MDFLSLPNEMCASVMKYCDFETIVKCRRMSNRLNKVSIKFKLNRVSLHEINDLCAWEGRTLCVKVLERHSVMKERKFCVRVPNNTSMYQDTEQFLKKVKCTNSLVLSGRTYDSDFDTFLCNNIDPFRKIKSIDFNQCYFDIAPEHFRFISKLPNLKHISIHLNGGYEVVEPEKKVINSGINYMYYNLGVLLAQNEEIEEMDEFLKELGIIYERHNELSMCCFQIELPDTLTVNTLEFYMESEEEEE